MLTYIDTLIGFAGVMLLLSLLVTAVVQTASWGFNLRGASLRWGVALLVGKALRGLEHDRKKAEAIAERILRDPTVSPNQWLATAIRSDEFVRLLRQHLESDGIVAEATAALSQANAALAQLGADADAATRTKAQAVVAAAEAKKMEAENVTRAFARAKDGWAQVYASIPVNDVAKLFPEDAKKAQEVLDKLAAQARNEMSELKAWFDTVMDRTTERFVARTRLITFVVAAVFGIALQIDSLGILKQIAGNAELRARLVHGADATLKLADDYGAKSDALATKALKEAIEETKASPTLIAPAAPVAEGLVTRLQGTGWIDANVPNESARKVLLPVFERHYDALLPTRLKEIAEAATSIKDQLGKTELVIVDVKSRAAWAAWWATDWSHHVAGVLLTIVFLSLGGPFWYNLLRQLANLRPLIAGKVDKDEQKA